MKCKHGKFKYGKCSECLAEEDGNMMNLHLDILGKEEHPSEFKTGDRVICENVSGQPYRDHIYLYTNKRGRHVCQHEEAWEEGDFPECSWSIIRHVPKTEIRVKGPVALMQALMDAGYKYEGGMWRCGGKKSFPCDMWIYCGGPVPKKWSWEPEWLEEIEVK